MITPTFKTYPLDSQVSAALRDRQTPRNIKDASSADTTSSARVHVNTLIKNSGIKNSDVLDNQTYEEFTPQAFQFRDENGVERSDLAAEFEAVPEALKGFVSSVFQSRHLRFAAEAAYVREAPERHALATAWASSQDHLSNELVQLGLSDLASANEVPEKGMLTGATLNIEG